MQHLKDFLCAIAIVALAWLTISLAFCL